MPALALLAGLVSPAQSDRAGAAEQTVNRNFDPRAIATELAKVIERLYFSRENASGYAAMLRRRANSGAYDHVTSRADLARLLTDDLQALAPDRHLRVLAGGATTPLRALSEDSAPANPPTPANGWVAPHIAYLRLGNMLCSQPDIARLEDFMAAHENARGFILDLRGNAGGTLAPMDVILPWFFSSSRLLMRMDSRATAGPRPNASPPSSPNSILAVPAPAGLRRYDHWVQPHQPPAKLADANLYVLTSASTLSAAEHMALALQHAGRAVVIGETTGGADHFGPLVRLPDGFAAFIPVGRSYLADTGKGWEKVGIIPDVPVKAVDALATALELAKTTPSQDNSLSVNHPAPGNTVRSSPPAVTAQAVANSARRQKCMG